MRSDVAVWAQVVIGLLNAWRSEANTPYTKLVPYAGYSLSKVGSHLLLSIVVLMIDLRLCLFTNSNSFIYLPLLDNVGERLPDTKADTAPA